MKAPLHTTKRKATFVATIAGALCMFAPVGVGAATTPVGAAALRPPIMDVGTYGKLHKLAKRHVLPGKRLRDRVFSGWSKA